MLEAQNRRIDDLMERIRLQQEKLDKQNVRIRTLQSQVSKCYKEQTNISALQVLLFSANFVTNSELFQIQQSRQRASPQSSNTDGPEQRDSPAGKSNPLLTLP